MLYSNYILARKMEWSKPKHACTLFKQPLCKSDICICTGISKICKCTVVLHCLKMWIINLVFCWTGARFDDGAGGDNEVQRTMLELINQLDGFDPRGNIKVLMATNRPDTLDPALMRPGRLDRKIEFGLPDLEVHVQHGKNELKVFNRKCEMSEF